MCGCGSSPTLPSIDERIRDIPRSVSESSDLPIDCSIVSCTLEVGSEQLRFIEVRWLDWRRELVHYHVYCPFTRPLDQLLAAGCGEPELRGVFAIDTLQLVIRLWAFNRGYVILAIMTDRLRNPY